MVVLVHQSFSVILSDTLILLQGPKNLFDVFSSLLGHSDNFSQQLGLLGQEKAEVRDYFSKDDPRVLFTKISSPHTKVAALKDPDPDKVID